MAANKYEVFQRVDQFIDSVALKNIRRISPYFVCNEIGIQDVAVVTAGLIKLADFKLKINYEVQCTECGASDFVLHDITSFVETEKECRACNELYTATKDHIWITFDILDDFREYMKGKASEVSESNGNDFFPEGKGVSVIQAEALQEFGEYNELPALWRINREVYSRLLKEVKEAPALAKKEIITKKEQGARLERLMEYLFNSAPRLFHADLNIITDTSEVDGLIEVLKDKGFLKDWAPFSFVECKNWSSEVGKPHIDAFLAKVKRCQSKVALLFTIKGITGVGTDVDKKAKDYNDANGVLCNERQYVVTAIFVEHDFDRISRGENFISILRQKYLTGYTRTA